MLDHFKANFGLWVLVMVLLILLSLAVMIYFFPRPGGPDFLTWLQGKSGEVLASIMTIIVGAVSANRRNGDAKNGNGTSPIPPVGGIAHP